MVTADGPVLDTAASPRWLRTGYRHFPYAAQQAGQWWVLRLNHGFPEHDMYTLFIDGHAVADATADAGHPLPLVAGLASLAPDAEDSTEPTLDVELAEDLVRAVSSYVNYGSEEGEPCDFCSGDYDGMARC
ncbi:hypothetical protein A4G26_06170 [Mycobacterium rhizamassiliense]|jgi:hypothetical protein|uniref:Uncharacterized protein n=1 Tax=Mycobacterium rhizamassiliense TaxID=1841860 RepID=A0A2U3NWJ8_9MYCO|nr:hypothetical protein [Mycobacterium rhizamassiliense]SPM35890.1 hypothetical protein A4G26_06170 [Mycobacterium rhizamassiliense]